jgi:hypothetical protein
MRACATNGRRRSLKSPTELAAGLVRYWHDARRRETQLLGDAAWPLRVPIGRPTAAEFTDDTARVRAHVAQWRTVSVGQVETVPMRFRSGSGPVTVPTHWILGSPAEWAEATDDPAVRAEQATLATLLEATPALFHRLLVRQRGLWRTRVPDEVIQAAALAMQLEPGMAAGRPLRTIALAGIDSKFMERHGALVTALLDVRFDDQASKQGLIRFLDAADEGEHWLLVVPSAPGLLPFARQRVRARELLDTALPASRILIVENERCLHLLPAMADTIAVLGAGLNLGWMAAAWLRERAVSYWGDLDTWGLQMLAHARRLQPHTHALLMKEAVFHAHQEMAVEEDTPASVEPPEGLTVDEQALYRHLRHLSKGRLEQEFIPPEVVEQALLPWAMPSLAPV